MRVQVQYANRFAATIGFANETIDIKPETDIAGLMRTIAAKYGGEVSQQLLNEAETLQLGLLICVNDQQILDPSTHKLNNGDEVLILTAVSGG